MTSHLASFSRDNYFGIGSLNRENSEVACSLSFLSLFLGKGNNDLNQVEPAVLVVSRGISKKTPLWHIKVAVDVLRALICLYLP